MHVCDLVETSFFFDLTYHRPSQVPTRPNISHSNIGEQVRHACADEEHADCQAELATRQAEVGLDVHQGRIAWSGTCYNSNLTTGDLLTEEGRSC